VIRVSSALASPLIHSALALRLRRSARITTPAGSTQPSSRAGQGPSLASNGGQRLGSKIISVLVALAVSAAVAGAAIAAAPAAVPVDERAVHELAAQLRCVVCQTLSVADSPSETANQMRQIIRERLAAGETPEQVRQYFVQRYGEWILLAPPKEGFNLLVWAVPFVGLAAGLVLVVIVLRRWSRKPAAVPSTPVDPAMRERIRREMSGGGHP
jgi:cytochrome c-type biogenesis protein CcmH